MINHTLADPDLMAALSQFGMVRIRCRPVSHGSIRWRGWIVDSQLSTVFCIIATADVKKAWATAEKALLLRGGCWKSFKTRVWFTGIYFVV